MIFDRNHYTVLDCDQPQCVTMIVSILLEFRTKCAFFQCIAMMEKWRRRRKMRNEKSRKMHTHSSRMVRLIFVEMRKARKVGCWTLIVNTHTHMLTNDVHDFLFHSFASPNTYSMRLRIFFLSRFSLLNAHHRTLMPNQPVARRMNSGT